MPPYRLPDGSLWFEGPSKGMSGKSAPEASDEQIEATYFARQRIRDLPKMSSGPRDFRRGDRWLPWHFGPDGSPRPGD